MINNNDQQKKNNIWYRYKYIYYTAVFICVSIFLYQITIIKINNSTWIINKISNYTKLNFGIEIIANRIEVSPFRGNIIFYNVKTKNNLFKADLIQLNANWLTLFNTPHIRNINIHNTTLNLNQKNLASFNIKKHAADFSKFYIDNLVINNCLININETVFGLPKSNFIINANGQGLFANQLLLNLQSPKFTIHYMGNKWIGNLFSNINITQNGINIQKGSIKFDNYINADFIGTYSKEMHKLYLKASGQVDLSKAPFIFRKTNVSYVGKLSGLLNYQTILNGQFDNLKWSTEIFGKNIKCDNIPNSNSNLSLSISGTPSEIKLQKLLLKSPSYGAIAAHGVYNVKNGGCVDIVIRNMSLTPFADIARIDSIKGVFTNFYGRLKLLGCEQRNNNNILTNLLNNSKKLSFLGNGILHKDKNNIGNFEFTFQHNQFAINNINIKLKDFFYHSNIYIDTDRYKINNINGNAIIQTDANRVSKILSAWNIGTKNDNKKINQFDMSGTTTISTNFSWDTKKDFHLNGSFSIIHPRWRLTKAEKIIGNINIDNKILKLNNIELSKNTTKCYGDLWLTWDKVPDGTDQIDMTYHIINAPIQEGLNASGIDNIQINGVGNGYIRLHGPFKDIKAYGQISAVNSKVFGVTVPKVSSKFFIDIINNSLRLTNLNICDDLININKENKNNSLAIDASIDIDWKEKTWSVLAGGFLDTSSLGINKELTLKSTIDIELRGPFITTIGPIKMPTGRIDILDGCIEKNGHFLDKISAYYFFKDQVFKTSLKLTDKKLPIFDLNIKKSELNVLNGDLAIDISTDTVNTKQLAKGITNNKLSDINLNINTHFDWNFTGLYLSGQCKNISGQFGNFKFLQPEITQFYGTDSSINFNLNLQGNKQQLFNQEVSCENGNSISDINISGCLPLSINKPIMLKVNGTSNLVDIKEFCRQLVPNEKFDLLTNVALCGDIEFYTELSGTIKNTTTNGFINLSNGSLCTSNNHINISNLCGTAILKDTELIVFEDNPFVGNATQGRLSIWGNICYVSNHPTVYNCHAKINDFKLYDSSKNFNMQGDLITNIVSGTKNNTNTVINCVVKTKNISYQRDIGVTELIINNILNSANIKASSISKVNNLDNIVLNIEVEMTEPIDIRTNFLQMRWQTQNIFSVTGNVNELKAKGKLILLPGGLIEDIFPAGPIVLEKGFIEFIGSNLNSSYVNITGKVVVLPYVITINLSGSIDRLQINFSSLPSLRQDQILNLLINPALANNVVNIFDPKSKIFTESNLSTNLFTGLFLSDLRGSLSSMIDSIYLFKQSSISLTLIDEANYEPASITFLTNLQLCGYSIPFIVTYTKSGEIAKTSEQIQWHFGNNSAIRFGLTQIRGYGARNIGPIAEIYNIWSPK